MTEPLVDSSGACTATCASRSPTAATSGAPTACRTRAWSGCPGPRCSPSRRSSASPGCASSGSASTASASPAASPRCGPTCRSWSASSPRCAPAATGRPSTSPSPPTAPRCGRWPATCVAAGLRRVNVSLDTLRRDRFVELTRRDELDHVLEGIDAAVEAGLDPVKVNAVVMRGVNDDEVVDLAALRPRPGRDRAVHRVDAARRRRAVAVGRGGQPGRDRGRHRRRVPGRAAGPRAPAGRAVRLPRRAGRGRRHPVGDPAVLRRVRPHPAHRRGPAAVVPVRGRRGRPARAACAAARPTTSWPARSGAAWPTSGPAT